MSDLETIMLKTVKEVELKDKDVLARVDFNVPIGKPDGIGAIEDDTRIRAALPTIKYILDSGARRLVLMTHVDPWDEISPTTKDLRLKTDKIATRLSDLLGMPVTKADDCIDVDLPETGIIMLENLRFHKEEKKDDAVFAKKIADLLPVENRVYVNDAFGTCHRAHASIHAIVQYFEEACAGLLLAKEAKYLGPVAKNPKQPFYAILGGSKVADKIQTIENLARKAKNFLSAEKWLWLLQKHMALIQRRLGLLKSFLLLMDLNWFYLLIIKQKKAILFLRIICLKGLNCGIWAQRHLNSGQQGLKMLPLYSEIWL